MQKYTKYFINQTFVSRKTMKIKMTQKQNEIFTLSDPP